MHSEGISSRCSDCVISFQIASEDLVAETAFPYQNIAQEIATAAESTLSRRSQKVAELVQRDITRLYDMVHQSPRSFTVAA